MAVDAGFIEGTDGACTGSVVAWLGIGEAAVTHGGFDHAMSLTNNVMWVPV